MMEIVRYLFGSPGPSGFGSSSTAEDVTPDLRNVTAIVTGATSGIGFETARVLALRGARLVLPARSLKAANDARSRLLCASASDIIVLPLDLSSMSSVRSFVSAFRSLRLPLNLLVNNAGRFSNHHALSEDGVELTFATNYLGHFLLTRLLLDDMAETAKRTGLEGRIVNVTSHIHGWFTGGVVESLRSITTNKEAFDPTRAYTLSKLANVLHTKELAERLKRMDANVTVNCVHPGVVRTRLLRDRDGLLTDLAFFLLSWFLKTISQAAATTCYVATNPKVAGVSGKYFLDCNEALASQLGNSAHEAARLWLLSEAMVAIPPSIAPSDDRPSETI